MAVSSARFMVCLSSCDFISICVVVWVLGLTMDAPRMGLPVTREPSVYILLGSTPHYTVGCGGGIRGCIHGYGGVWVLVGLVAVELGGVC